MCRFIPNAIAKRSRATTGKGVIREGIAAENARETDRLVHSGASVPPIGHSFDKRHPQVRL